MTVVAIANRHAVSLATDSVFEDNSGPVPRLLTGGCKLFPLSDHHPVAIAIHGEQRFLDHPWSAVVGAYRREKKGASEPTIDRWTEDFASFVAAFGRPSDEEGSLRLTRTLSALFRELDVRAARQIRMDGRNGPPETEDLENAIDRSIATLKGLRAVLPKPAVDALFASHRGAIDAAIPCAWTADAALRAKCMKLIRRHLAVCFSPIASGLVVAGFGSSDTTPALGYIRTDGHLGPHLKMARERTTGIVKGEAIVKAFGRGDVVDAFVNGMSTAAATVLWDEIDETLGFSFDQARGFAKPSDLARLQAVFANAGSSLKDRVDVFMRLQSKDVLDSLQLRGMDDMVDFARSLISTIATRRKFALAETDVGPPFDCTIVTRSGGSPKVRHS